MGSGQIFFKGDQEREDREGKRVEDEFSLLCVSLCVCLSLLMSCELSKFEDVSWVFVSSGPGS